MFIVALFYIEKIYRENIHISCISTPKTSHKTSINPSTLSEKMPNQKTPNKKAQPTKKTNQTILRRIINNLSEKHFASEVLKKLAWEFANSWVLG